MITPTVLAILFALGVLAVFSKGKARNTLEGQEPPVLGSKIPFVGHLIGILKWQVGYMQMLSSQCPSWPAFTLRVFTSRIYVICDPSLIQAVYRNPKVFDFGSFVVEASERMFDISAAGMKIVRGETAPGYDPHGAFLNGNNGESFLNENRKLVNETLSPGPGLEDLKNTVLDSVATSLNGIGVEGTKFGLYRWMRDILTVASAEAIYGPHSPFTNNPSLVDDLWHFDNDATLLMLKIFPTILAQKAYYGRANVKAAFAKYYAEKHDRTASSLIQAHVASCRKWGFSDDDIANFEISTLYLATTNTVATTFWQISYILSDPSLLAEIRAELKGIIARKIGADGEVFAVMDVTLFQSHCPLLISTFHETLRLVGQATSVRAVVSPTNLSATSSRTSYSLQSPAVIQLPASITHNSPAIWGQDAQEFNPTRFLPETKASLDKETRRKQSQGYFPFGGGKHLCPGRHFATTEILSFVAALVLGFEITGSRVPERAFQKLGTGIRKPVGDVEVGIKRRKEWEGVRWIFDTCGKGEVNFGALVGDDENY